MSLYVPTKSTAEFHLSKHRTVNVDSYPKTDIPRRTRTPGVSIGIRIIECIRWRGAFSLVFPRRIINLHSGAFAPEINLRSSNHIPYTEKLVRWTQRTTKSVNNFNDFSCTAYCTFLERILKAMILLVKGLKTDYPFIEERTRVMCWNG